MFGALAHGKTHITNLVDSADVRSTRGVLETLGVPIPITSRFAGHRKQSPRRCMAAAETDVSAARR